MFGSGAPYDGFFRVVEQLSGQPLTARMALAERAVLGGDGGPKVDQFIANLTARERLAAFCR